MIKGFKISLHQGELRGARMASHSGSNVQDTFQDKQQCNTDYVDIGPAEIAPNSGGETPIPANIQPELMSQSEADALAAMRNLAQTYWDSGYRDDAIRIQEVIWEISWRIFGDNQWTLAEMGKLALMYWNHGRETDGSKLQELVVMIMRRVLGEQHSATFVGVLILETMYLNNFRQFTGAFSLDLEKWCNCFY